MEDQFEQLANEAMEELPTGIRRLMENVHVIVEDYPDPEVISEMKLRSRHDLLGLYQGVPQTKRGSWYGAVPVLPDRIILYRKNIVRTSTAKELKRRISDVLIHEIAHHFGMDEDEVRAAGY